MFWKSQKIVSKKFFAKSTFSWISKPQRYNFIKIESTIDVFPVIVQSK